MTTNDIRETQANDRALRYFDGGRKAFQERHPNKARFPWWLLVFIACSLIGFAVKFGPAIREALGK